MKRNILIEALSLANGWRKACRLTALSLAVLSTGEALAQFPVPCDNGCDSMASKPYVHPTTCKSCNQGKGPRFTQRLLDQVDRFGDALEASLPKLLRDKKCGCDACACDAVPSCGVETPSCGVESPSCGVETQYFPMSNSAGQYLPEEHVTTRYSKVENGIHISNQAPPRSSNKNQFGPRGIPQPPPPAPNLPQADTKHVDKKDDPGMSVPAGPDLPDDWKKDPFQDDARNAPANRYKKNPVTQKGPSYNRAYDPQAFIAAQHKSDLAKQERMSTVKNQKIKVTDEPEQMELSIATQASYETPVIKQPSKKAAENPAPRIPNGIRRSLKDE